MNDEERYKAALEAIAEIPCGVPGHAVAVGCGSSWLAKEALEGRLWRRCGACYGRGFRNVWDEHAHSTTVTSKACDTCAELGWLAVPS